MGFAVLAGLYLSSRYNYLLFHSIAEVFSILIAFAIFVFSWNTRKTISNNYLALLGVAYLFVGVLDLLHVLAYKGMNVFEEPGSNLATQLWIGARFLESLSLLVAPLLWGRRLRSERAMAGYAVATCLFLISVFAFDLFPTCHLAGTGLTPFKKVAEYIICTILFGALVLLFRSRKEFDPGVFRLLVASVVTTIGAELTFTLYVDVYGFVNLLGHFLKIVSFFFIYKAIIETGLSKPFELLFRTLKQHEQELEKRARIIDQTHDSVVSTNLDGIVQSWNKGAERQFGYSAAEALGRHMAFLYVEDIESGFQDDLLHVLKTVGEHTAEIWLRKKSGETFCAHVSYSLLRDEAGNPTGIISYSLDITDRKCAEEERRRLEEIKDRFLRIASHDLKNPLTAIDGLARMAREFYPPGSEVTEDFVDCMDRVLKNTRTMHRIVADFLDFHILKAGKLPLEKRPIDLNALVRHVMDSNYHSAAGKDIELTVRPDSHLSKVVGDSARIIQVIQNIVDNALKFSPRKSRVLVRTVRENGTARIEVCDQGPGIREEDRERVFEEYDRLDTQPTTGEKSSGLGLAICKMLVNLHGGRIGFRNNQEGGCTFWFELPSVDWDESALRDSGEPDGSDETPESDSTAVEDDGRESFADV
jgi:PAS domain S-box-containing protein